VLEACVCEVGVRALKELVVVDLLREWVGV